MLVPYPNRPVRSVPQSPDTKDAVRLGRHPYEGDLPSCRRSCPLMRSVDPDIASALKRAGSGIVIHYLVAR
eukprot:scaffold30058_cov29-Prasinocladus_malaysianus.AAC.4